MAAQQGFVYEQNATKFLKSMGFVPANFTPAGAGHDQPDLMLLHNDKEVGVELKITAASAGSLVIKYDNGEWKFGDIKSTEKEKLFLADVAEEIKLFDIIKRKWKKVPLKRTPKDKAWKLSVAKIEKRKQYEIDSKNFPEINGMIDAKLIEKYYKNKSTYYVNVGSHGFYTFGRDIMGWNSSLTNASMSRIPSFSSSVSAKYRARVQYKGSGNYQFTFELSFGMKKASPYNIAPIRGKSVIIDESKADLSFLSL